MSARTNNLKHLEAFVHRVRRRRAVVACQADAAGLAAGELARRFLSTSGGPQPIVITPAGGELLVGRRLADRARAAGAEALLAVDLGAAADAVLPRGPTLFIDHHRHETHLPAPVIEPSPRGRAHPGGVVLWQLIRQRHPRDASDWAHLAAIAKDSGHPRTAAPQVDRSARRFRKSVLKDVAVLLNSAGRASLSRTAEALALLDRNDDPQSLLDDASPELDRLHEARAEVLRAVGHWSPARPHFMWRVALVPVSSPCRIEPILAAMWQRQLDKYMVVVANSGRAAGKVTVVARSASRDRNLLRLLDAVTPEAPGEAIALGRRDYVEAVVDRDMWKTMLRKMRFRSVHQLVPPPMEATLF